MEPYEIEVKFHVADVSGTREKILGLGAECKGRVFEANTRYDNANHDLAEKKYLLRLRKDSRTVLTFKSPPENQGAGKDSISDSQFKIHREIEVEVDNFSNMDRIIESLGFTQKQVYEKWRETFTIKNAVLCLDTMPFGDFLEIEGKKSDITALAQALEFKWKKRIILNYIKMFDIIKKGMALPFTDITFENFNKAPVDLMEYLPMFEAG